MNTLQKFEARQLEKLRGGKEIPDFAPGDTVKVNLKIREGSGEEARERIQAYEGICTSRCGKGYTANFTVRKISYGEGVERVFPLFSPRIESIELIRRGSVRRAKLYYLRDRRGKSARITERTTGFGMGDDTAEGAAPEAQGAAKPAKKASAPKKKAAPKAKKAE
jgi:large subunit ribosomal protein L19